MNYVERSKPEGKMYTQCLKCNGDHKLSQCPEYIQLSVEERWVLAKTKGCCYSCLSNGHTVRECRNRHSCGTEQCRRQHHPSLHSSHKAEDTQVKNVFHSTREVEGEVSLGVIPILLSGPKGTVTVYALLDSGANTTLIRKDIIKRVGIDGSTTEIKINTISGELSIDAVKYDFVINFMDSTDSV